MKLKRGDVVEFKKYEDINDDFKTHIGKNFFPKSGKIMEIKNDGFFTIEYSGYLFNPESVARVISDVNFNPGDEILVKATIKEIFEGQLQINPSVDRTDVVKILKRKTPEHFIVKENYYGMYIGVAGELVSDKDTAKVYTSRDLANKDAANMHLNAWDVISYDD
jgi:hypothetical protein